MQPRCAASSMILEDRAQREEAGDAPVVEEGTEGVRIMTVHSAKGLEFPIVLLADLTCNETAREARRFVDPERRLVRAGDRRMRAARIARSRRRRAAPRRGRSRARALCRRHPGPRPADRAGGRRRASRRMAGQAERQRSTRIRRAGARRSIARPPGCPSFRATTRRQAPAQRAGQGRGRRCRDCIGRKPGAIRWSGGTPSLLRLDARETMGLRQIKLLEADEKERTIRAGPAKSTPPGARRGRRCSPLARPPRCASQPRPNLRPRPPDYCPKPRPSSWSSCRARSARPHGTRFGTLVHAILSRVALTPAPIRSRPLAVFFGRALGAPEAEIAAASEAVARGARGGR